MTRFPRNFLRGLAFLAFTAGAYAAPFVAPAEENPSFRRDLLPIDSDSMAALSGDLTLLVRGIALETPADRRAAAQSLALALALDPANVKARDATSRLVEGKDLPPANPHKLTQSKARLWQIHAWLGMPEAGADGQILGDMMGDAASVLDPSNPLSSELRESAEKGKWDNWVAPISAFEEEVLVKNGTDPFEDIDPDIPPTDVPAVGKPAIKLQEGTVTSVLLVYDEKSETWRLSPTPIEMKANPEGNGVFDVNVVGVDTIQDEINEVISQPILKAVTAMQGDLPKDGLISITTNGGGTYSLKRNRLNMTGPGFILANSALSGVETDATVIACLDEKGGLHAPEFFWRLISALKDGKGGRLVIPAGTEEYFTAMLTLEKPELLLNYEVLVASTPKQLVELCAKVPSEKYAASFASFQEIKAKGQGTALGTYLANRFVRQRLQEIGDAAPFHLSAQLLAKQGAGERPRSLPNKILAAELWRAINPIADLATLDMQMARAETITKMERFYDSMRTEVDNLERYTDLRDRDLISEGKDVAITVRTLSRALRGRTDDLGQRYQAVALAHKEMVNANNALVEKLSKLSGDPLPDESGKLLRIRKRDR